MFKLQRWVDKWTTILSALLCALFMAIVVYNVAVRYLIVGGGIQWYMESSQYLNVWAMFIAGIGLCATNGHLRVSLIDEVLKGKIKTIDRVIVALFTFVFYLFVAYSGYLLATRSRQTISTMEPLKMAYVYWLLPFASGLSALAVVLDTICFLKGETEEQERGEHDNLLID